MPSNRIAIRHERARELLADHRDWLRAPHAWIGGFEPPKRAGRPFRYLELGCGQGFGLCLLAAANSGAEFLGVDFQPEHVEHAQRLAAQAGLSNVRFLKADFLDLARDWPADFGIFDYVTLHGIISYLSPPLISAVMQCLSHAVAEGGLVYISYNAQPGCLSTVPLQHIAHRIKEIDEADGAAPAEKAIALIDGLAAADAPVFQVMPALKPRVDALKIRDRNYLVHEYLSENWNLFWHSDVARELRAAALDFAASATLADNLVMEFLPQPLREPILEQSATHVRQDLQDFVINQAFRRDIFCRGARPRSGGAGRDEMLVHAAATVLPGRPLIFDSSFGQIEWAHEVFANIVQAVSDGPKTLGELFRLPRATQWMPRHVLLLAIHANLLAIEAASPGDPATAQRFNAVTARDVSSGAPYDHLAAARLGSGVRATRLEMLLLDAWFESGGSASVSDLADGLERRLSKLGTANAEPQAAARTFVESSVPLWRRLGVIA